MTSARADLELQPSVATVNDDAVRLPLDGGRGGAGGWNGGARQTGTAGANGEDEQRMNDSAHVFPLLRGRQLFIARHRSNWRAAAADMDGAYRRRYRARSSPGVTVAPALRRLGRASSYHGPIHPLVFSIGSPAGSPGARRCAGAAAVVWGCRHPVRLGEPRRLRQGARLGNSEDDEPSRRGGILMH